MFLRGEIIALARGVYTSMYNAATGDLCRLLAAIISPRERGIQLHFSWCMLVR